MANLPIAKICALPPGFGDLLLINDGKGAFANQFANIYFISYGSIHHPDDNIGNFSPDGKTWTPTANNTDPPSHFVLTVKDFPGDCNFFPVFDLYDSMFAIAWLESNPVGRLNLKYSDIPVSIFPPTNPSNTLATPVPINEETIYIYPNTQNAAQEQTENVPLSDLEIVDVNGNRFNLDAHMARPNSRGYELTMPNLIKAVRFGQTFHEEKNLQTFLGTAIQEENRISLPLSNIGVTIYYGKTNQIYKRLTTDSKGKFEIVMKPGSYTFELGVNTLSINYSQRFV